ncbi:MAG TPA: hypothetical protein VHY08_11630 [Bacillota bacterium]|nr:hypothetical protein [Bacillota bacterium]
MAEIDDSLERLPHPYEKRKSVPNKPVPILWRFLSIFTQEIDLLRKTKEDIKDARDMDLAAGATLDKIGSNVQQLRGTLKDNVYRTLVKSKIMRNINQGDVNNLIDVIAFSMGGDPSEIEIIEKWTLNPPEPAGLIIKPPIQALLNVGLTAPQFTALMNRMAAGGVKVDGLFRGSFRFATTYDQPAFDSDKGFNKGKLGAFYSPLSGGDEELPL